MAQQTKAETQLGDNARLLDRIFRDPETKHGLKVFQPDELARLQLSEQGSNIFVVCVVTSKKRAAKPEEIIRQLTIRKLVDDLHYPLGCIDIEVPIKMGVDVCQQKGRHSCLQRRDQADTLHNNRGQEATP